MRESEADMQTEIKLQRRITALIDAGSSPYDEGGFDPRDVRALHDAMMRLRYYTRQAHVSEADRKTYRMAWRHAAAALRLIVHDAKVYAILTAMLEESEAA
jgi:hypothetical protein